MPLKKSKGKYYMTRDSPVIVAIKEAVDFVTKNVKFSKDELLRLLVEEKISTRTDDGITSEIKQCANYIFESIEGFSKKLNGDKDGYRYSPHVINVAMTLFLRSKTSYDELRSSGLLNLPSQECRVQFLKLSKLRTTFDGVA